MANIIYSSDPFESLCLTIVATLKEDYKNDLIYIKSFVENRLRSRDFRLTSSQKTYLSNRINDIPLIESALMNPDSLFNRLSRDSGPRLKPLIREEVGWNDKYYEYALRIRALNNYKRDCGR